MTDEVKTDIQNLEAEVKADAEQIIAEPVVHTLAHDAAVVAFEEVEAELAKYANHGSAVSGTEARRIASLLAKLQTLLGLDPAPSAGQVTGQAAAAAK